MNDMRKLINLMEGVVAIPGLRESEAEMQTAATASVDNADAEFDAAQGGATEVDEAQVDTCRQSNPRIARDACAMEESSEYDHDFIRQAIIQFYDVATSEEELKKMVAGETGYGHNPDFDNMFHSSLDHFLNGDDSMAGDFDDGMDGDFDSAMASAGHGSDEDYGGDDFPMEESDDLNAYRTRLNSLDRKSPNYSGEYAALLRDMPGAHAAHVKDQNDRMWAGNNWQRDDKSARSAVDEDDLNNGYDDIEVANGNDFFPNGADSPVVSAVGPSGARQGDNPEQKKMQVAETHKELVYAYRNYLKETATHKSK